MLDFRQSNSTKAEFEELALAHLDPLYSAALRLDPNLAAAHNNLAVLQLQKGQIDLGAAELRLALKLRPDDPETQYNLAMALNQQERWNEAADLFSRLGSSRQDDPKFHFQFGLALAHERKTKEAMSHYARALLLQPDYPEALDRLSWILATDPNPELRNGTEAVRMASSACELTSNKRPEMLLTLAAALAEEGRYSEAQIAAQRAGALASDLRRQDIARKCDSVSEVLRMDQPWRE